MRPPAVFLMLGASPAVVAGFFVLSISRVGRSIWLIQAGSVLLMIAIAAVMTRTARSLSPRGAAVAVGAGVSLCALPLLGGADGPRRWITFGSVSLYVAPFVIPALLAVAARATHWGARGTATWAAALGILACVLAAQPDLSQVLALTAGAAIIIVRCPAPWVRRVPVLVPFAAASVWAAVQADPLAPVGYVEQVIKVSWAHSILAGVCVSAAALGFVATTAVRLARIDASLVAVAAYYAVLLACSVADLTPAPLIGYGAGPLLGFALLAGTVARPAPGPTG
jgi:cell division protein FtsW (lipid II flippase)